VRKVDVPSSQAGRFSLSLRGVRKELRRRGRRANELVKDVEDAMKGWLDGTTTAAAAGQVPRPVDRGEDPSIMELSHNSLQLKWKTDDPFARYIIHCVARWHSVVSFSKLPSARLPHHSNLETSPLQVKTYKPSAEQRRGTRSCLGRIPTIRIPVQQRCFTRRQRPTSTRPRWRPTRK
jgi:hypothetical protein